MEAELTHYNRLVGHLNQLVGFHRQLLDCMRAEKLAIVSADLKSLHEATTLKQALIQSVSAIETDRQKVMNDFALLWKVSSKELVLSQVAIRMQGIDLKAGDQLRHLQNTLGILIDRIQEQNTENKALIERSLTHLHEMKRNVLGEAQPASQTYGQHGKNVSREPGARLISKEA